MNPRIPLYLLLAAALPAYALDIPTPAEAFIRQFDRNQDQRLSLSEFLAIRGQSPKHLRWTLAIDRATFHKLDRNRNGYLDSSDKLADIHYSDTFLEEIGRWPH
ncbi:hypothetical protein L1281_002152 [Neisseria sp. HSC-16F19]|nr:hypothetical protein [Neisseria sp. HSC-16F19]MCP2041545.1 hypothetical protein [Neisseria sp. HSC-16F19]